RGHGRGCRLREAALALPDEPDAARIADDLFIRRAPIRGHRRRTKRNRLRAAGRALSAAVAITCRRRAPSPSTLPAPSRHSSFLTGGLRPPDPLSPSLAGAPCPAPLRRARLPARHHLSSPSAITKYFAGAEPTFFHPCSSFDGV